MAKFENYAQEERYPSGDLGNHRRVRPNVAELIRTRRRSRRGQTAAIPRATRSHTQTHTHSLLGSSVLLEMTTMLLLCICPDNWVAHLRRGPYASIFMGSPHTPPNPFFTHLTPCPSYPPPPLPLLCTPAPVTHPPTLAPDPPTHPRPCSSYPTTLPLLLTHPFP